MTMKYMITMLNRKLRVKLMQTYTTGPVPPALIWVMKFLSNKTRLTNSALHSTQTPLRSSARPEQLRSRESNREPVLQKHKSCEAIRQRGRSDTPTRVRLLCQHLPHPSRNWTLCHHLTNQPYQNRLPGCLIEGSPLICRRILEQHQSHQEFKIPEDMEITGERKRLCC